MTTSSTPRDEHKTLLGMIQEGRLFAVQEWIKAGKPLRLDEGKRPKTSVLYQATQAGFHSMVEELLCAGGWHPAELSAALELARELRRFDLADLLNHNGARAKPVDFATSCDRLDLFMMEQQLRAGADPGDENIFAQMLDSKKARPLLKFFRQFHGEFPALDVQASLALAEAVKNNQVRWTALLVWAGADPFISVPDDLYGSFPVDPENCTSAARQAVWSRNPEILKVLRLKPTPGQAIALLDSVCYRNNFNLLKSLLDSIPKEQINETPRRSSTALETLVSQSAHRNLFSKVREEDKDAECLKCVELMLDAGAHWNPESEKLRRVRRDVLDHADRYIVQLLRLLLYTPEAANVDAILELCRSQTLMARIGAADAPLVREIEALRKDRRKLSVADASTNTETQVAESDKLVA